MYINIYLLSHTLISSYQFLLRPSLKLKKTAKVCICCVGYGMDLADILEWNIISLVKPKPSSAKLMLTAKPASLPVIFSRLVMYVLLLQH